MKPDRVVIGIEDERRARRSMMKELYGPFTRTGAPILMMDTASAELCKYAANSILATRISFMNEIANVCELVGADVDQVRKAIGADRRIGTSFLFPGVGYGGSCFPKDVKALLKSAQDKGYDFRILRAVEDGERPPEAAARREDGAALQGSARARRSRSGAWRSSRGPTTCARRRRFRSSSGCSSAARRCAPTIRRPARWRKRLFDGRIALCEKSYDALSGRRRAGDRDRVERVPRAGFREDAISCCEAPVVFDGRNIYSPEHMRALGFTYFSIGRLTRRARVSA